MTNNDELYQSKSSFYHAFMKGTGYSIAGIAIFLVLLAAFAT